MREDREDVKGQSNKRKITHTKELLQGLLFPQQEEWGQNYNEIPNSTIFYGMDISYSIFTLWRTSTLIFMVATLVCIPTRIVNYIFSVSSTVAVLVRFSIAGKDTMNTETLTK